MTRTVPELEAALAKCIADLDEAKGLLGDCREELEHYSDVKDGSYGEPEPNSATSLCTRIDVFLNGYPI